MKSAAPVKFEKFKVEFSLLSSRPDLETFRRHALLNTLVAACSRFECKPDLKTIEAHVTKDELTISCEISFSVEITIKGGNCMQIKSKESEWLEESSDQLSSDL